MKLREKNQNMSEPKKLIMYAYLGIAVSYGLLFYVKYKTTK